MPAGGRAGRSWHGNHEGERYCEIWEGISRGNRCAGCTDCQRLGCRKPVQGGAATARLQRIRRRLHGAGNIPELGSAQSEKGKALRLELAEEQRQRRSLEQRLDQMRARAEAAEKSLEDKREQAKNIRIRNNKWWEGQESSKSVLGATRPRKTPPSSAPGRKTPCRRRRLPARRCFRRSRRTWGGRVCPARARGGRSALLRDEALARAWLLAVRWQWLPGCAGVRAALGPCVRDQRSQSLPALLRADQGDLREISGRIEKLLKRKVNSEKR